MFKIFFFVGALFSCSHMNLSCDQQIPQTCAISGYLRVLPLHLCPVCALKAMFPGLHTPVMDCMKYVTAPRGALHQYNSPELTSSAALQQCCISHRVTDLSAKGPNGKQDAWFEGRNGHKSHSCQMLLPLCQWHLSWCGLLFGIFD